MTLSRAAAALLVTGLVTGLLTACGSDADSASGGSGGPETPCDVTDQATVASVFPGASAGKPGQSRNCSYTFAKGTVNVYLFDGDLDRYKKQAKDNDIAFTSAQVGDAAIKDQLHTLTVQQGDVLFAVQTLGTSVQESKLAEFDDQNLFLAKKIAADL